MKLKAVHVIICFLLFALCLSPKTQAQIPTRCFEIQSILADACGSPEGENEMVRLQAGPSGLNTNNLKITWPNNPWKGFCTDPVKLDSLNRTIVGCGYLISPPGGIVPAGAQALIVTSTNMNVAFNSFANLTDTLYLLFQCAGNTSGHFVNYNSSPGVRTLIIVDTTTLCGDTVSYDRSLLTNITGGHGGNASVNDGASISYAYDNTPTYYNNGCNASFVQPGLNAGNDTTYAFCTAQPVVQLHGIKLGGIRTVKWIGGVGTFSQPDSLNTTYTVSNADISPIHLYLTGKLCPDTLYDTITITIAPPIATSQAHSICQGSSYHIGTHNYTAPGTFVDTLTRANGCDSVVTTVLTVISATNQTVTLNACGNVIYKGITYTASTSFQDTLRGSTGCDSIRYAVSITVRNPSAYYQVLMLCPGQTLAVGTHSYSTGGSYTDTVPNAVNCDSIITTVLSYAGDPLDAGSNVTICSGDSTQLHGTGGLTYAWTPTAGLSSTTIANPIAKPATTTTYHLVSSTASANQIVNGDFSAGNTGFSSSYTYTTPTNVSAGEYNVTSNPSSWNSGMSSCGDHTTGSGKMLVINGATTANTPVYCQTVNVAQNTTYAFSTWLASVYYQSPAQLQFSINSALIGPVFTASSTTCLWQQFYTTWNSGLTTSAQICIVNQNTAFNGNDFALDDISFSPLCTNTDSVIVTVIQPTTGTVNHSICQGSNYLYNGHTYSANGTYLDTIRAASGCDSIVTTHLTVLTHTSQPINLSSCSQIIYKGITYTSTTTFPDTLKGSTGCDSILYTVNIRIDAVTHQTVIVPPACSQVTYNGHTYTSSTSFSDTLKYRSGCDSIITAVTIVVNQPAFFSQSPLICQGQSFTAGTHSYNTSGTYTDVITGGAASGCDSTVTTNLTVITPVSQPVNLTGCAQAIYKGTIYTSTTSFADTLKSVTGCDSIHYAVSIRIDAVTNQTVNVPAACGLVTYNGTTYTFSRAFNDTLKYLSGCDSIINAVTITVNPVAHFAQSATICQGASFPVGTKSHSASGTYIDTIAGGAVSGCDSIITTTLTVVSPVASAISVSGTCAVNYLGQTYTSDAVVKDTLRSQQGCDSVYRTATITVTPVVPTTTGQSVCINAGQSYFAGGQNQTAAGTYRDTVRTPGGCDSTYRTTALQVVTPVYRTQRIDSCYRATIGGTLYTSDAVFADTVRSALGCDSVYRADSLFIHSPSFSVTSSQALPLVEGDSTILSIVPAGSYYNIVWSPDSNISDIHTASPQVSPMHTTTYAVIAADTNNCRVSASIEIPVVPNSQPDFVMPTAFSPNGDGVNELFRAIVRTGAEVTLFHVYNRWGELIYDKSRDNSAGWDGTFKNVSQPIDVYTYFITIKGVAGNIVTHQGNLTLIR